MAIAAPECFVRHKAIPGFGQLEQSASVVVLDSGSVRRAETLKLVNEEAQKAVAETSVR